MASGEAISSVRCDFALDLSSWPGVAPRKDRSPSASSTKTIQACIDGLWFFTKALPIARVLLMAVIGLVQVRIRVLSDTLFVWPYLNFLNFFWISGKIGNFPPVLVAKYRLYYLTCIRYKHGKNVSINPQSPTPYDGHNILHERGPFFFRA